MKLFSLIFAAAGAMSGTQGGLTMNGGHVQRARRSGHGWEKLPRYRSAEQLRKMPVVSSRQLAAALRNVMKRRRAMRRFEQMMAIVDGYQ